jgi:hypothetical protein
VLDSWPCVKFSPEKLAAKDTTTIPPLQFREYMHFAEITFPPQPLDARSAASSLRSKWPSRALIPGLCHVVANPSLTGIWLTAGNCEALFEQDLVFQREVLRE